MQQAYFVRAHWDDEAAVWHSSSDIPGLVIEAETLTEFEKLVVELAPEMLAENADLRGRRVSVDVRVDEQRRLDLAVA